MKSGQEISLGSYLGGRTRINIEESILNPSHSTFHNNPPLGTDRKMLRILEAYLINHKS